MAFRIARHQRPFTIDAMVILLEHLHAIWTLPSDDSDYSGRWKRIKAHFTHRLVAAGVPVKRHRNGEYALWQRMARRIFLNRGNIRMKTIVT